MTSEEIQTVAVGDCRFSLRTTDKRKLDAAAEWLNKRLKEAAEKHPMLKPAELSHLVLLEMAFERLQAAEEGKDLLKDTEALLEWLNNELR